MALGDIKTFIIDYGTLVLEVDAIDNGDGTTTFVVRCTTGSADINAIYWNDGDTAANEGTFEGFNAKKDSSLNMNGTGEAWDGGEKLSSAGLGKEGTDKATYLTAGETLNAFTSNVSWDSLDTIGIRATSTSTAEGSIKGVADEPDVTPAPDISVVDAECVVEGGKASFTINLSSAYDYDIKIYYETGNGGDTATEGDDYDSADGGYVIIKAGETSATVEIMTTDDLDDEPDEEHFTFKITKAEVNLDDDADIELDLSTKITDGDAEGCIEDNDNGGGGPPPPDDDHFPEWGSPSISHVTFYFHTGDDPYYEEDTSGLLDTEPPIDKSQNDPDGWFTVKFDDVGNNVTGIPGLELSNDLDDWVDQALDYIAAQHPDLDMTTLEGVSIKGGTSEIWYEFDGDPDDDDTAEAPDVWTLEDKQVDQSYDAYATAGDPFVVA